MTLVPRLFEANDLFSKLISTLTLYLTRRILECSFTDTERTFVRVRNRSLLGALKFLSGGDLVIEEFEDTDQGVIS